MNYFPRSALLAVFFIFSLSGEAMAQAQPGGIPEFIPTSPWVVADSGMESMRGLNGIKLPCMMVNQFDNGFVMRLAGGGGSLTAMAVDFRQNVFARGMRYGAALYTDAGFRGTVQGSAFNASTLIFNLRDAGDVYNALKASRVLGLSMGNNDMRFSLSNVAQGFTNLEGCYSGEKAPSGQQQAQMPPQQGAAAVPYTPSAFEPPTSLNEIRDAASGSAGREVYLKRGQQIAQPAGPRMDARAGMKSTGNAPSGAAMGSWNAKAGEDIKTVVSRWSQTAGVDLQWQSTANAQVVQNFAHNGSFNDAVSALLAENAAASGLHSKYDDGASARANAPTYVAGAAAPRASAADPTSAYAMGAGAGGMWKAPKGGSLQSVLQQWGAQQKVEVIWYANGGYTVKEDINQGGTFESALQTILQSYENDNNRPVARLNTDPASGRKVLVIESDRTM